MDDSGGGRPSIDGDRLTSEAQTRARIERAIGRARLVLLWEEIWPRLAPFLVLAALFAAVSWFGLWRLRPRIRPASRSSRRLLVAAALPPLQGRPAYAARAAAAALSRVEADDRRAASPGDRLRRPSRRRRRTTRPREALWAAHRARLLASLGRLKAGIPAPDLARRDPSAFRFLVALLFVVAFVYAGSERFERLSEAFRGGETGQRDDCADRCLGDAARPIPAGRRSSSPARRRSRRARSIRSRPAASSRCAPAAPTISTWSASSATARRRPKWSPIPPRQRRPAPTSRSSARSRLQRASTVAIRKGEREVTSLALRRRAGQSAADSVRQAARPDRERRAQPHLYARRRLRRRLRRRRDRSRRPDARRAGGAAA